MERASPARARRPAVEFGAYAPTEATSWRPVMADFLPRYRTTPQVIDALRRIERIDHELGRHPRLAGGLSQRLRRETLARNAYATASIEGNPLTLSQVESLLRLPSPASAREADELEILNYAGFMTSPAATTAPRATADVLRVHEALFRGVLQDAGSWKRAPNFIGSAATRAVVYVPSMPERVEPELENALRWLHEATSHPPLVRAMLFHHEFESIHPFRDGNGRAGRALTPMILHEFGYAGSALAPIDLIIHERRDAYYGNLALVERNGFQDHTPWLEFMVGVVRDAYEEALASALLQDGLPAGLTWRQRQVVDWFAQLHREAPERRVKFNDVHHAFPEIPERTLKRDLAALRDAGALHAEGVRKGTTYRLARG